MCTVFLERDVFFYIVGYICELFVSHSTVKFSSCLLRLVFVGMDTQVCPICVYRMGMDLIEQLTMQHGSFFKISLSLLLYCCDVVVIAIIVRVLRS